MKLAATMPVFNREIYCQNPCKKTSQGKPAFIEINARPNFVVGVMWVNEAIYKLKDRAMFKVLHKCSASAIHNFVSFTKIPMLSLNKSVNANIN